MNLKKIAATLPSNWQYELKRLHFQRQMRKGKFVTDEPEYKILDQLVSEGDWVIDVGANIGHYTKRLSEIVGASGRVMAFEPIPETFALLANNVRGFKYKNVTLFNAALSNQTQVVGFDIPTFDTGLQNYYEAHIAKPSESSDAVVLSIQLNEIGINNKIALVKVDAEGHEDSVIEGMTNILHRDKPTLILENASPELREMLTKIGYKAEVFAGSPNVLFRFGGKAN